MSGANDPKTAAERVESKAENLTIAVKKKTDEAVDSAKKKSEELTKSVKATVDEKVGEAKNSVLKAAEKRREQAAGKIHDYQRAAAAAASKLKGDDDETLGDHLQDLSGKLADVSEYLEKTDVKQLVRDAGKFTRKHPEIVLGGTVLLGFAVARFLKTSAHETWDDQHLPARYARPMTSSNDAKPHYSLNS